MYLLFIALFLVFLWQIHRNTSYISESLNDYLIKFFVGLVSCIIPTGFLLSELNQISHAVSWGIGVNTLAFLFYFFFKKISENHQYSLINSLKILPKSLSYIWKEQSFLGKSVFGILGTGLLIVSILNLVIFYVTYPNEWDSMTGHLVKCALYLQNGNMNRLQGTTWTIDFYPNSLPTLQMFGFHLFGEQGFKVIHYLSYWVFALSSYGIAFKISKNYSKSLFVFLLSALLPTALVQATTTETDIVLTAYLGCLTYFLFSFKEKHNKLNISLIALVSGIWIGHKVTFLLIAPAALVVAFHTVLLKKAFYQYICLFIITLVLSIGIYALPTGYIGNVKEVGKFSLGSLSAPPIVMQWHGIEHYSTKDKIRNFALNIGRYSSDFFNLDGIRGTDWGRDINKKFRYIPNKFFDDFNLEGSHFTVVSYFSFEHPLRLYRERPYWGIISFGMVIPIILILIWKFLLKRKQNLSSEKSLMILSVAALLHFLSLSYSAPYDPIKGRYFLNMAVWCMPLLTMFFIESKSKAFSFYSIFSSIIIAISAICSPLTIRFHPIFETKNIFNTNRLEQLTIGRPDIYEPYKKFDEIVPKDATVALGTQQEHEDFEYPLWGEHFKRKLIPIHPFRSAVKPIPAEAQYLFYSKGVIPFQKGDIRLGVDNKANNSVVEESEFYLRKLTPNRPIGLP